MLAHKGSDSRWCCRYLASLTPGVPCSRSPASRTGRYRSSATTVRKIRGRIQHTTSHQGELLEWRLQSVHGPSSVRSFALLQVFVVGAVGQEFGVVFALQVGVVCRTVSQCFSRAGQPRSVTTCSECQQSNQCQVFHLFCSLFV